MAEMLISNLIGLAVGLGVAWAFSRRATRELENVLLILARFLEQYARQTLGHDHPVKVGFSRDKKGRVTNASIEISLPPAKSTSRAVDLPVQSGEEP